MWAGVIVAAFVLGYYLRTILTPFILSLIAAYILAPLVDKLESWHIPRVLGVFLLLLVILIGITAFFIVIIPTVRYQVEILSQKMPDYIETVKEWILPLAQRMYRTNKDQASTLLDQTLGDLSGLPLQIAKYISSMIWESLSKLVNLIILLVNFFIIPFATFYLLKDTNRIKEKCLALIPPQHKEAWVVVIRKINGVLSGFIRGQLTVSLVLAAIYSIGLLLTDTPLGLIIALVAGFANIIPYFGLLVGLVPALILSVLQFADWQHPLGVLATFTIAQALEGTVISPRIVGQEIGLHPVLAILAVMVGGKLFGFYGIIMAVPMAAIIKVFLGLAMEKYLKTQP